MVWCTVNVNGMENLTICEGTINAERLEKHLLPSGQRLFQGRSDYFIKPMREYVMQVLEQFRYQTDLSVVHTCVLLKTWNNMNQTQQQRCQLKSYMRLKSFRTSTVQTLIVSLEGDGTKCQCNVIQLGRKALQSQNQFISKSKIYQFQSEVFWLCVESK